MFVWYCRYVAAGSELGGGASEGGTCQRVASGTAGAIPTGLPGGHLGGQTRCE